MPQFSTTPPRFTPLFELLLTFLVVALAAKLAGPLGANGVLAGLDGRYLHETTSANAERGLQAMALGAQLPARLATLALCGWLALRVGRSRVPRLTAQGLIGALWLGLWGTQFAAGSGTPWLAAAGGLCTAALFAHWRSQRTGQRHRFLTSAQAVNAIAYPGWVLFTGLGLIWLVDYSARGYPKLRFLALAQFDALFAAYAVLTLMAACGPALAGVLARVFAALDRASLPRAATGTGVGAGIGVSSGWRGKLGRLAPLAIPLLLAAWALFVVLVYGAKRPALTSELLRLPFYLVGGWVLFRWASQGRAARALAGGALATFAVLAGLLGTRDFGQVLLLGLGLAIASGTAVALVLGGQRVGVLAGVLVAVCIVSFGLDLINQHGHWVSKHIGERAIALDTPFAGKLDYLSQLRWFAASTPALGHPLTQVPWCGTLPMLARLADGQPCNGVPKEIHSDYVFAALAGVWGSAAALVITAALALWLVSLVRAPAGAQAGDPNGFRRAVFACFVAVTLVQLLFTALGSVGLVVLTGITYPLLAFGGASLLASAGLLGLGMQR